MNINGRLSIGGSEVRGYRRQHGDQRKQGNDGFDIHQRLEFRVVVGLTALRTRQGGTEKREGRIAETVQAAVGTVPFHVREDAKLMRNLLLEEDLMELFALRHEPVLILGG